MPPEIASALAFEFPTPSASAAPSAAAPAVFDLSLPINAALALACHHRVPCRLYARTSAGRDERGHALEVIGVSLMPLGDAEPTDFEHAALEQWGVVYAQMKGERPELHLLTERGWGGMGLPSPDDIEVAPNRVTLHVAGLGYALTRVVRLSPLSSRMERMIAVGRTEPFAYRTRWSWDDFGGEVSWFHWRCWPDGGGAPGDAGWGDLIFDGPDGGLPPGGEAYLYVPSVTIDDPAFATEGWRTTDLGRCAVEVDASGARGFLVQHGPGEASDAVMRVLGIGDGDFVVEVRNDATQASADAAVHEDRLDVWAANAGPHSCEDASRSVQWTVNADDGVVAPGIGKPSAALLAVTRVMDGNVLRLKVHLSAPHGSVAFVYNDLDHGKSRKRVFATSRVRGRDPSSLGEVKVIDRKDATCLVVATGDGGTRRRLEPFDTVGTPKPLEP